MSFWLSTRGERVDFPFLESTSKCLCVNRTKGSVHAFLMEFMHGYLDYSQHPIPPPYPSLPLDLAQLVCALGYR